MLSGKLLQHLTQEARPPSEAEVAAAVAKAQPNSITLIPIRVRDVKRADALYKELTAEQRRKSADAFTTTFDQAARREEKQGQTAVLHKTFSYATTDQLPVEVRSLVGQGPNSVHRTKQADGTSVISLVLHDDRVPDADVRMQIRADMLRQKQQAYVENTLKTFRSQAAVSIDQTQLPLAARTTQ